MKRRALLATSMGLLSGCTAARSLTDSSGEGGCECGLVLTDVFPREVDRDFISGEYVRLENISETTIDATGYTVEYDEETEFTIPELEMESGSPLNLVSRSGEDTTLQSAPPIYIVFASFGDNEQKSVMGGSGSVTLRTPDGELRDKIIYDENQEEAA